MSKMRLIVAGAGGRMGRALVRAIADSDGAELAGALEAPGSELIGKDASYLQLSQSLHRHEQHVHIHLLHRF